MSKLIEKLTALAHLDPDEIVKKLSSGAWVRVGEMTEEYWDKNQQVRHVYWTYSPHHANGYLRGGHGYAEWLFPHCSSNFEDFKTTLDNDQHVYWVIPFDVFDEKVPPPCPS